MPRAYFSTGALLDAMQRILAHLAEGFRHDGVNLVVAHSYIAGAKSSGSERIVTMGDEWAATAQSLPAAAQYVALGHVHRPQRIDAAGPHTQYAGSPMQLDFGEVDDEKSFVVIDVSPGKPPRVERVPYQGAAKLGEWAGTMTELERDADTLRHFGFLKVRITLDGPIPDLNRRARQILPNIVVVDAVLPESSAGDSDTERALPAATVAPLDQFRTFYQREHQREALRQDGDRMIGVISHRPELTDRLPGCIHVIKGIGESSWVLERVG